MMDGKVEIIAQHAQQRGIIKVSVVANAFEQAPAARIRGLQIAIQGRTIDKAALADYVRDGVSEPPARPRSIVVIDEMPVTPVGKIFKPRLREIAAEEAARELLNAALPGVAFEVKASHVSRGLLLTATVPESAVEAARRELGGLPVAFELIAG